MNERSALYIAVEQAVILPYAREMEMLAETECYFSDKYKRKIKRLIKDRSKPYYPMIKTTFRKIILIIAAALLMGSITALAVSDTTGWLKGLFVKQNSVFAEVLAADGDVRCDELSDEYLAHEPQIVPDGFSESERLEENGMLSIIYTSENGSYINYSQDTITAGYKINTENMTPEYVNVGNEKAFISYNDESAVIVWSDGEYSYCICAQCGYSCKNDIIKMAYSLSEVK